MYVLPPEQYRKALKYYGLTQGQAQQLFNGRANRTGRRWVAEGAPFHVALILSLMHRLHLTPRYIDEMGEKWRKQMKEQEP
jgi:hypothetical protein